MSAQHFSRVVVLADYMTNMERYKKDCVNKAKPMLHCNGKCQVKLKLEAQDREKRQRSSSQKLIELDYALSSKSFFPEILYSSMLMLSHNAVFYFSFSSSYIGSIFHPPTIIS